MKKCIFKISIISILIGTCFTGDIAYPLPNHALRKPLIFEDKKELSKLLCYTIAEAISGIIKNNRDVETVLEDIKERDRGFFEEIKAQKIIWDVDEKGNYWVYQHEKGIYLMIDREGNIKEGRLFDKNGLAINDVGKRLAVAYYQEAINKLSEKFQSAYTNIWFL